MWVGSGVAALLAIKTFGAALAIEIIDAWAMVRRHCFETKVCEFKPKDDTKG